MNIGDYIDQILLAQNGVPPYRWEAELPDGLKCRPWGSVFGVAIKPGTDKQTARLVVWDAQNNRDEKQVNLVVQPLTDLQPDFCTVQGGDLFIGYHPSRQRDEWLNYLGSQGFPISAKVALKRWPASKVHVDSFFIQTSPVTNLEYEAFVNASGRAAPIHWSGGTFANNLREHPVVNVTYEDALAYCEWKTKQDSEAGLPYIYSIPTHWQWEKAAKKPGAKHEDPAQRDSSGRLYPWGDQWGSGNLHDLNSEVGHTVGVNRHGGTTSGFGVCDLGGNVSEWVDGGEVKNGQVWKHLRGASWSKMGQLHGLTFVYGFELVDKEISKDDIGFRCTISVKPEKRPTQTLIPLGGEAGGYIDAAGDRQHIGRFYMARHAVSNEEFSKFKPIRTFIGSERWQPVTNVSYQQAVDFCKWKTQQEGRFYRLPSLQEWERAYRGTEGREYPWGEKYSKYYCNSLESGWGRPVDIWALWQGTTPEGIYNLCGNTFEWLCEPEAVAIGGSWCSTCASYGKSPFSDGAVGEEGRLDIGFRYVTH